MKSGLKEWKIKAIFSYPTSDSPKKLQIPCKVKQFLWLWLKEWKVSPRVYRQWRTKCLKSLEWAERCSGETNEDKVNWQEEPSRKAGKILPGFLAGLCPRGQQGSLSVPQRDPNPKLCLGGIRSTRDGVQILENLRVRFTSSSLVLFCTLLALPLPCTLWIIRKLEHTQDTWKIYRNSPLWTTLAAAKIPMNLCLFLSTGLSVRDLTAIPIKSFCLHSNKRRFLYMFLCSTLGCEKKPAYCYFREK